MYYSLQRRDFKNIFANNLTLKKLVKVIDKTPKIYIIDQISNKQTQMVVVHQFSLPNESPKIDLTSKKYKCSVNYCRNFESFRDITINGNLVTVKLYSTV